MWKLRTREREEPFPVFSNYMHQDKRDCMFSQHFPLDVFMGEGGFLFCFVFNLVVLSCFVCSHNFLRCALKEAVYRALVKSAASAA